MNNLSNFIEKKDSNPDYTIICGDNAKVLKTFPDNFFDLTVTSAPYDNMRDYNGYSWDINKLIPLLWDKTKEGGIVAWVIGDKHEDFNESLTSLRHVLAFQDFGWKVRTLIYKKNNFSQPSRTFYHHVFEFIYILMKGKPKTYNPLIDRKNKEVGLQKHKTYRNRKTGKIIKGAKRKKIDEYGLRFDIWPYVVGGGNVTKDKIAYDHSAIMPEKLAEDLILGFSNPGDKILDIFNGSGTTLKMAYKNHRESYGIEISEEYCELAEKRMKQGRPILKNYLDDLPFRLNKNKKRNGVQKCL